jgi:hypothetical protein
MHGIVRAWCAETQQFFNCRDAMRGGPCACPYCRKTLTIAEGELELEPAQDPGSTEFKKDAIQ